MSSTANATPTVASTAATAGPAMTVGTYLRDLPPDRRVAMARVCSMIRRSARGVRESMRYGLAFYELDGPLFALESGRRHMSLYIAEREVVVKHKEALPGVNTARSFVKFSDLNRLPLDVVEKIVRDSVAARRTRVQQGAVLTQADLLKLWAIKEEAAQVATTVRPVAAPPPRKSAAAEAASVAAPVAAEKTAKAAKKVAAKMPAKSGAASTSADAASPARAAEKKGAAAKRGSAAKSASVARGGSVRK